MSERAHKKQQANQMTFNMKALVDYVPRDTELQDDMSRFDDEDWQVTVQPSNFRYLKLK